MASLSLCLMDVERILFPEMKLDYFNNKASFLSRLGSGSASRSIKGPICIWGSSLSFKNSNDYYAIEFGKLKMINTAREMLFIQWAGH